MSTTWENIIQEPPIPLSEITTAIAPLKERKALGPDQLTAEIIKATGTARASTMYKICDNI